MFHKIRLFIGFVFICACIINVSTGVCFADDANLNQAEQQDTLTTAEQQEIQNTLDTIKSLGWQNSDDTKRAELYNKIEALSNEVNKLSQQVYNQAQEEEQSFANRMLGGLSMAAMGLGGMQMAQGLQEMSADKVADQSMNAYVATMRCKYGHGKQVKWSSTEVHTLPVIMKLIP